MKPGDTCRPDTALRRSAFAARSAMFYFNRVFPRVRWLLLVRRRRPSPSSRAAPFPWCAWSEVSLRAGIVATPRLARSKSGLRLRPRSPQANDGKATSTSATGKRARWSNAACRSRRVLMRRLLREGGQSGSRCGRDRDQAPVGPSRQPLSFALRCPSATRWWWVILLLRTFSETGIFSISSIMDLS